MSTGIRKYMLGVLIAIIMCFDLTLNSSGQPIIYRLLLHVIAVLFAFIWAVKIKIAIIPRHFIPWIFLFAFVIISILQSRSFSIFQTVQWTLIASFLLFYKMEETEYNFAMVLIILFSLFQCVGVLMELFFPKMWLPLYLSLSKNQFDSARYQLAYAKSIAQNGYLAGFAYNPGYTAIYIVNGIAATFSLKSSKKNIFALLAFQVICLFITGKRAHAIFIVFALAVTSMLTGNSLGRRMIKAAGLMVVGIILYSVGYYIFFYSDAKTRITRLLRFIYTTDRLDTGSKGRLYLWKNAYREFLNNKFLGMGWGAFGDKFGAEVHNTYLQVFCEAGVIAGIFFAIAMLSTVFFVLSSYSRNRYTINGNRALKGVFLSTIIYVIFFSLESTVGNTLWGCEQFFMFFLLLKSYDDLVLSKISGEIYAQ